MEFSAHFPRKEGSWVRANKRVLPTVYLNWNQLAEEEAQGFKDIPRSRKIEKYFQEFSNNGEFLADII